MPVISVLMTAYNREKYIAEAIESVLASDFRDFELIIVDDASTDRTVKIARNYEKRDRRVSVVQNNINTGQFQNRNKAASLASGKYIKFLDSDDTIRPDGLGTMFNAMENAMNPCIGIVINDYSKIDFSRISFKVIRPDEAFLAHYFNNGLLFPGPSGCIYRKDAFLKTEGFPLHLGINGDVYLNLRMAALGPVALFSNNLIHWRQHEQQVDADQVDYFTMHTERYLLNKAILAYEGLPLTSLRRLKISVTQNILFLRGAITEYLIKGKTRKFFQMVHSANVSLLRLPIVFIPISLIASKEIQLAKSVF